MIRALILGVAVKAVAMTIVATLLDVTFVRGLLLVLASAVVSGGFALLVTFVQIRENRQLHSRLDQIEKRATDTAQALDVNRRKDDPEAS